MNDGRINVDVNPIIALKNYSEDVYLLTKLRLLKDRSQFVDVTLMSNDGYSCRVHACVVAAQSDFLHHWISSRFKAKKTSKDSSTPPVSRQPGTLTVPQADIQIRVETFYHQGVVICLDQLSSVILLSCVKYMYGEDLEISHKDLEKLYKAASILKLGRLQEQCREHMSDHTELPKPMVAKSKLRAVSTDTRQRKYVVAKKRAIKSHIKETEPLVNFKEPVVRVDVGLEASNGSVVTASKQSLSVKSSSLQDSADVMFYYDEVSGKLQISRPCVNNREVELDPVVMELITQTIVNKQTTSFASVVEAESKTGTASLENAQKTASPRKRANKQNTSTAVVEEVGEVELDPSIMELITQAVANKQTTSTAAEDAEEVELDLDPSVLELISKTVANKPTTSTAARIKTSTENSRNAQNTKAKARAKVAKKSDAAPRKRVKRSKEVAKQIAMEGQRKRRNFEKTEECVCNICGLKCIGRRKFKAHMAVHKREHVCKYCGRAFAEARDLPQHIARHEKQYSVLCDECDFKCLNAAALRYHKRKVHSDEPFPCSKCSAVFPTESTLKMHHVTHRAPLKCEQCDFVTQHSFKLNRHIEEFHTDLEVACSYCGRFFGSFHKARRHELRVHGKVGNVTGLGLKRRFRTQDHRHGTVEDTRLAASLIHVNKENTTDVTYSENSGLPSVCHAETQNATQLLVETSNYMHQATTEIQDVHVDQGLHYLDTSEMNFVLTECADIPHALSDVIYVDEGTGRILSEEEVLRSQLQVVHSQELEPTRTNL